MTQDQFDCLSAEVKANKNYINLGFDMAKAMLIDKMIEEKKEALNSTYDFNKIGDNLIEGFLQAQLKNNPIEPEPEAIAKGEEEKKEEAKGPKLDK